MDQKKLEYVDSLRGLAILGVLVVHCSQTNNNKYPYLLSSIINSGSLGVQLFYFASAFTLFRSSNHRKNSPTSTTGNFFIRRFFRIAPLYYLSILFYILIDGLGPRYWLGDQEKITVANIISNLTFTHGLNPYWITSVVPGGWSVAIEWMFYLLFPLFFARIKNLNIAVTVFIVSIFIRFALQKCLGSVNPIGSTQLWNNYLYFYLPSQIPVFFLGIIFYFLSEEERMKSISPYNLIGIALILFLVAIGVNLMPVHIIASICFLFFALALEQKKFKLFVNPVIGYLGKISYSLYLVHIAVLDWLNDHQVFHFLSDNIFSSGVLKFSLFFLCVLSISVIIGTVTYNCIEVKFQNLGKRIIRNRARLD